MRASPAHDQGAAAGQGEPGHDPVYSWYVVAVLSFAGVVAFIDRQIINLLVEPIKADLGVSDTQISLLQGIAFSLFYAIMALPLARLSDSGNRKQIIILGAICWTIATFTCGLAGGLAVLFVSRMMVGVGEATLTPGGFSMISDYFPREQLSRALSVFTSSSFLGSGLAFILGGAMIGLFSSWGPIEAPLIGD
ncbi:MAG: MFS transporter, partial [Pseudomonadota bacterium]